MGDLTILSRCQSAELELVSKGATPAEAQAAVRQSLRWSRKIAAQLSAPIREQATLDLLERRLRSVEGDYLAGLRDAPDPAERTRRYVEGMRAAGAEPGPETIARYEGAQTG